MQLYKTIDNEEYIRIEEEDGGAVTLCKNGDVGTIVSLYVPQEERRLGVGRALLAALEQEVAEDHITLVYADYVASTEGVREILEDMDYTVDTSAPVLSVSISELLASEVVQKMMKGKKEICVHALSELMLLQLDELIQILSKFGIRMTPEELVTYSQKLSGVAYDEGDNPQALVLCKQAGDVIHVELLLGLAGAKPQYIMAVLQELLSKISASEEPYRDITLLSVGAKSRDLLSWALGKNQGVQQVDAVCTARKQLDGSATERYDLIIEYDPDELWQERLLEEYRAVPMQGNAGWKMDWQRHETAVDLH